MPNVRKYNEKIALQKQKEAEATAEFEEIMKELHAIKIDETQVVDKMILEFWGTGGVGGDVGNTQNLSHKNVEKQRHESCSGVIGMDVDNESVGNINTGVGLGAGSPLKTARESRRRKSEIFFTIKGKRMKLREYL